MTMSFFLRSGARQASTLGIPPPRIPRGTSGVPSSASMLL
jgi:hypothetical protein